LQNGRPKLIRTWNGDPGGFARVCADGDRIIARGVYGFVAMEHDHDEPVFPLSRIPYQLDAAASVMANDGEVWITLKEGGVLRIRPNAPGASSPEQLFHNAIVLGAYKDLDGGLWIMTDGIGVLLVTPDQIDMRHVVLGDQYRTRAVSALCTMPEGGVAFGTMNGSLYRYEVGAQAQLLVPSRSMAVRDRVRDIQLDVAGRLWFATDSWIGHLSGAGHRTITGPFMSMDDLYPDMHAGRIATAKSIATGPHGEVVASMFNVARLLDTLGKEQFLYEKQYRTDRERIYAPFVDRHGQLWYETSAQLHRWARGTPSDLSSLDSAFGARITDVDELPDGTMVVATDGNGLVLLRNDAVVGRIGHRDGMPSDRVNTAVVRGDRILVATDAGGCIVDHAHGDKVLRSWDVHAGLPSAEVFDIDGDDRYVYFATPAGLCVAPLNSPMYARRPPRLSLQMFISGDSVMSDDVPPTIPLGADALIRLRAPEFASPGRMEYFMRQDGDTLWSPAKQELSLAGLEAGTHRFEFKARILGSPWSEVVGLMVVIEPPWYASTWFRSLGFLLFIGLGGLIAWLISRRRFQRREAGLHLLMAKQEERQRIAAGVHDDLGADISHLLMLTRESAGSTSLTQADRDNLRNIEMNANGIMQKVDEIIWSLDPRDDEGSNALGFIQGYAEAFADAHNMVFRTQALPDLSETRITPTDRREVYLIVKELLNNIAKHTQATELRIVFSVNNGMARIVIDDNGEPIGAARLSANTLRRGHGLANMQERIARLSGTLRSEALQPIGTRVSITFPIGSSAHEAKGQLSSLPPDPAA
jgi:signal transduction histidine kinase/streptogramin lyase